MNVLAIESSSSALGVAAGTSDGIVAAFLSKGARRHVELLQPAIESVLELAGIDRDAIDGIVVDIGPGLFTGLRAGVACAKGLSLSLGIPAVGIRSTSCLRAQAEIFDGSVVAAIDVRRGEVAIELPGAGEACLATPEVLMDHIAELVAKGPVLCVGNGFESSQDELSLRFGSSVRFAGEGYAEPSAEALARLGSSALIRGEGEPAAALDVVYLREADASITWTTRSIEVR